jgi:hypothetical protein
MSVHMVFVVDTVDRFRLFLSSTFYFLLKIITTPILPSFSRAGEVGQIVSLNHLQVECFHVQFMVYTESEEFQESVLLSL